MKFKVNSSELLKVLKKLSGIIANNAVLPILEDFCFQLYANELVITASDLETTISSSIDVELISPANENGDGVCIPANVVLAYLKNVRDEELVFHIKDDKVEFYSSTGKYKIPGNSVEEYVKMPEPYEESECIVSNQRLLHGIENTLFATSNDDLRPAMTGVLFKFEKGNPTFVATDGYRMVSYTLKNEGLANQASLVIPKKPLSVLKSIIDHEEDTEVSIQYTDKFIWFIDGKDTLCCRLLDVTYPDYKAVIPDSMPYLLTVNAIELKTSLKRLNIFTDTNTNLVTFDINENELKVSVFNYAFEWSGEEKMPAFFNRDQFHIHFRSKFFIDMLDHIQDESVCIGLIDSNKAATIYKDKEDYELLMLLMPIVA